MSLYGNDDSNANKTKAGIGVGASSQAKTVVFIDDTEAQLKSNKDRGLNAPGWWSYFTYTDSHGTTRHKAEQLVYIAKPEANASETQADDTIGADVLEVITLTSGNQPANSTSSSGAGTFAVTVSVDQSGTPAYVWQRQTATGNRWTNIAANTDTGITYANFTTATLGYSGLASDALDGYKYRVKVTTSKGATEVISNGVAALTFGT
jgi:L-lactate utilization protein LutC